MSLLNKDLIEAKEIFETGEYTCVLCRGNIVRTSKEKGIMPLVRFVESNEEFTGFSAADKIIGRAAAFLYILMGVASVHGAVMSKEASKLLLNNGTEISFDVLTDSIINRKGDDICPMEKAVVGISEPQAALCEIKKMIDTLNKK